jgi:predicted acylesterase/phospholipase RssA
MSLSKKFANPKVLFDRTLPLTSIMASEKVTKFTRDAFGNLLIEDQWIPFFCVASNLTTAEQVVFKRGQIWRAVRSSLAIPGVFTPVMDNGDTIVDGGVMDNFPARLMAGFCESDCIIGVNVSPFKDKKRNYDFDTSISGWRILFSRINPFAKPLRAPSLTGVILRSIEINSVHRAREDESYVDVMIYPDVKQFGITEYDQFEEITRIGYEAALEPLREWKEKGSPA